jgi:hypothetical protein
MPGNNRRSLNYISNECSNTVVLDDNPVCKVEQERRKQSRDQRITSERKKVIKVMPEKKY